MIKLIIVVLAIPVLIYFLQQKIRICLDRRNKQKSALRKIVLATEDCGNDLGRLVNNINGFMKNMIDHDEFMKNYESSIKEPLNDVYSKRAQKDIKSLKRDLENAVCTLDTLRNDFLKDVENGEDIEDLEAKYSQKVLDIIYQCLFDKIASFRKKYNV